MGEAKFCLKVLFELASESRRKDVANETQISDLQNQHAEVAMNFSLIFYNIFIILKPIQLLERITAQEKQMKAIQTNHEHELSNVAKECEEKIAVLLRQLRNIPVAEGNIIFLKVIYLYNLVFVFKELKMNMRSDI